MTKFRLVDDKDNVIEETEIVIGESDTLLMSFKSDMSLDLVRTAFDTIRNGLECDATLIAYPQGITLKVLKKR